MTDEENLRKIRERVDINLKYAMESSSDGWIASAQIFLQLQILKRLDSIDDTLITMGNDSWSDHHER